MNYMDAMNEGGGDANSFLAVIGLFVYLFVVSCFVDMIKMSYEKSVKLWGAISLALGMVLFSYSAQTFSALLVLSLIAYINFLIGRSMFRKKENNS